jgi:SAM-dependent methyltransferase
LTRSDSTETVAANVAYYDAEYGRLNLDRLIDKLGRWPEVLGELVATHITWHSLYGQAFGRRIAGARVLELGCGDGLNALMMARLGAEVTAVDISPHSERILRTVSARLGPQRVIPVTGDFAHLDFPPVSYDFVVGKDFLHHITHDQETAYLAKIVRVLKPTGEARFCEPAVNSASLDALRWLIPVPGRPSALARRAFRAWKARDPHPVRDQSSRHYRVNGARFFEEVEIVPFGSLERFHRLLPRVIGRPFRRRAHVLEERLPHWFRSWAARSQLIVYRRPRPPRPGADAAAVSVRGVAPEA